MGSQLLLYDSKSPQVSYSTLSDHYTSFMLEKIQFEMCPNCDYVTQKSPYVVKFSSLVRNPLFVPLLTNWGLKDHIWILTRPGESVTRSETAAIERSLMLKFSSTLRGEPGYFCQMCGVESATSQIAVLGAIFTMRILIRRFIWWKSAHIFTEIVLSLHYSRFLKCICFHNSSEATLRNPTLLLCMVLPD